MRYSSLYLVGQRFGLLTVIRHSYTDPVRGHIWECQCDCGIKKSTSTHLLKSGRTKHCGCIPKNKKHGMSETRIYSIWQNMLNRCNNKNDKAFPRYGGRGITVCKEWHDFVNFYNDTKEGYSSELTLDRIENNGSYNKENCKWSTAKEQQNNTRRNHYVFFKGQRMTVTQACRELDIALSLISTRLSRGWSLEESLTPAKHRKTKRIALG